MEEIGLSQRLSAFDYATNRILPRELLNALQKDSDVSVSVRGRDNLSMKWLGFENQQLRVELTHLGRATDQTNIPTLYIYNRARKIYYDPETGERLGDGLGINDWLFS